MFIDRIYNVSLIKDCNEVIYSNSFYDYDSAKDDFISVIIDGCSDTSNIDFDEYVEKGVFVYDRLNEISEEMNRYEVYCNEVNLI